MKEWYVYGSSADGRVASVLPHQVTGVCFDGTYQTALRPLGGNLTETEGTWRKFGRKAVFKRYEIKDHLGNVRAVVSDIKNPQDMSGAFNTWKFDADCVNLSNYYAYGKEISEGSWASIGGYMYGYNGMERETGTADDDYTTLYRHLFTENPRWASQDPLAAMYPSYSPYVLMGGNPISFTDPYGLEPDKYGGDGGNDDPLGPNNSGSSSSSGSSFNYSDYQNFLKEMEMTTTINQFSVPMSTSVNTNPTHTTNNKQNEQRANDNSGQNMGSREKEKTNKINENEIINNIQKDLYITDLSAYIYGFDNGSFRLTDGAKNGNKFSPAYYYTGWGGGSTAKITTYKVSLVAKGIGTSITYIGIGIDVYGLTNYYNEKDPNEFYIVTPKQFTFNLGLAGYSVFINPVPVLVYTGLELFYPGGFVGAMKYNYQLEKKNQEILGPSFKLIPSPAGP